MKKLHRLIITSFLGPFVLTFGIVLFILVMQFLWKYIDDIIGKDIEFMVLVELMFYVSANLVPMALPLAILLASIMTFGNLGEHFELVAMKSSGLSLRRIMGPLTIFIIMLSIGVFYFSNNIWPIANLKFASLLYDVRHKKPTLDIAEGIFYKGIEGFVIRIGEKGKDGHTLKDITIYDHRAGNGNVKVVRAESGRMDFSEDDAYFEFVLFNGNSYNDMNKSLDGKKKVRSNPLIRSSFKEQVMRFDLSGFEMHRSDEGLFKDNFQMLTISQLNSTIDTLYKKLADRQEHYTDFIKKKFAIYRDTMEHLMAGELMNGTMLGYYSKEKHGAMLATALNMARSSKTYVSAFKKEKFNRIHNINRHYIEWHRKFILSYACLLLFFIGAPLGAIIRKGGLGMPVVVSVIIFLIYHILSISGEKLVKQDEATPFFGMWMASIILTPLALFITYKATTDSPLFEFETYTRFIDDLKSRFNKKQLA